MANAVSRIAVEVTGQSTTLQAAASKAADALKGLGDVVAKQSKASMASSDAVMRSNKAVALSYESMARAASSSTRAAAVSYEGMTKASKATAAQTAKTADMQKLLAAQTRAAEVATLRGTQALRKDEEAHRSHQNALQRTGTALDNTGKKMQNIGHVMAPVSLGLLAVGVYSIKAATTFQSAMELIRTQAGASQAEVNAMSKAVLNMAPAVDIGPNELAKGLFHLESAGYRGKEALGGLDSAAKGAAIGQANLEDVTNSLIAVLRTGIGGVHGARDAMGQLNAIIGEGNMRMQDLTAAIATGLPLSAKQVGISLRDMGAALDLMTIKGVPASKAATSLRFALLNMAAPSTAGKKALEGIGLAQGQLAEDLRKHGLLFAVEDLTKHMKAMGLSATKETELLKTAFGGIRSSAAILTLTQDVGGLQTKLKQLGSGEGAKAFEEKFAATSKTTTFKWHQMTATIESDSIKMGTTLLPVANKIVGDVTKMVDWFTKLPKPVKDATEGMVALGAVIAPIALAMGTISRLGGILFKGAGGIGSVMKGTAFGGGGISGARSGGMGPGSPGNPIVTVMEDAQYAGLGGRAAPGGTAQGTTAEKGAAGAASRGVGGTIAGVGSKVLGRALGAGSVLGLGLGASELAGGLVGGSTGSKISGIGTDATFGAAIGTAIEPGLGTAIGGGLGAIAGALKAFGPQPVTAPETRAPGTPKLGAQFMKEADRIFRAEQADIKKQAPGRARVNPRTGEEQHFHTGTEESATKAIQEAFGGQRGEILGKAESQFVLGGVKFPGVESITNTIKRQLALLPPAGRVSMMTFVKQMAQTLEHEGRIPQGSLQHMIAQFKPLLATLPMMAGQTGEGFNRAFAAQMKAKEMQAKVAEVVKGIRGTWAREFGFLPVDTHMTMTQVLSNATTDLEKLKYLMTHGTKAARDEAAKEYKQLAPILKAYTREATGAVDGQLRELAKGIGPLAAQGTNAFLSVYNALPPALQNELARSAGAVGKGIEKINDELVAALKALGVTVPKGANLSQLQAVKAAVTGEHPFSIGTSAGIAGGTPAGRAMGGYIGSPGERGGDTVPAMLGRGEAVLNYQQQAIADRALAAGGYGGLGHLFAATAGTKHYMASGGYAGYALPLPKSSMMPGSWSIDQGVDIPAPAGTPEFAIGPGTIIGEGIQGFGPNAPILKITAGPLAGMNVYYGHAGPDRVRVGQSVSAGQQISEVGAGIVGISTGPHIEVGFGPPFSHGDRMAQVLKELMSGAGVAGTGAGAGAAASIAAPGIGGPGGLLGRIGRAAVAKVTAGANEMLGRLAPGGAGVVGRAAGRIIGGPWQTQLRKLAQQKGWSEHDWLEIVASESGSPGVLGSGDPKAVEGGSGAFGLGQVLGAARQQYPKMTSPDGATQIEGMAEYIAARYGNPTAAWQFHLAHNWYATGRASSYHPRPGVTPHHKGLKAVKPHRETPGTRVKKQVKPLSPKQLQTLASLSGEIVPKWEDAQGVATQMQGLQQLFQAQEGEGQYLNPDGSLNPVGIAKKEADDQELIRMQERVLGDYSALLPLTSNALTMELGKESNIEAKINKDKAIIAKDNKTLALDKERIARLRAVALALRKPTPDAVKAIQAQITQAKAHWDPLVKAAENARAGYIPQGFTPEEYVPNKAARGKAGDSTREANDVRRREIDKHNREGRTHVSQLNADERRQLEAAVRAVKGEENSVLSSLRDALARAKAAQAAHKYHVALEGFHLSQQISSISGADLKLTNKDKALSETDAQLKEALGGQAGAGTALGVIENIAGQLGTVKWDSAGHFVGIDTTDQGAAFNAGIQLISLRNDLAGVARAGQPTEPGATSAQENSALVGLLQQQNTQLAEAYALSQAQFKVLTTFAPNIPHFASGGPVLNDGLIYAHQGEHVVPAQGTLVRDSAQRVPEVHNHFTVQGSIAPLIDVIDQRIRHPDNIRQTSRISGMRTSMLAGAPGGFR